MGTNIRRHTQVRNTASRPAEIRTRVKIAIMLVLLLAVAAAGWIICGRLGRLCDEQCVITDLGRQVAVVNNGSHIRSGLILEGFGLRVGANLARIDFDGKRREIMERIPNLRRIEVFRHLPDRVEVKIEEREPVARLNFQGNRSSTGRVVDADGVVFMRENNTGLLPVIIEPRRPGTAIGRKLENRADAALRLVTACQAEFSDMKLISVATSPVDYLLASFEGYNSVKLAWEGMDEPTPNAERALHTTLSNLRSAFRSNCGNRATVWKATIPGRIFADTKEPLQ